MRAFICTVFFTFLWGFLYAQNQSAGQISGSVLDATNASPLPNAYLFLKNYPDFNGTAGPSGEFSLNFPDVLKNDTLVVSILGYQRLLIPLSRLNRTGNRIRLDPAVIALNEVIVKPKDTSLEEMIVKAIENIPINYPDRRHQLAGLYRKVSTDYEEFTHLVEASVVVEDVGYGKDVNLARIKVESLRQSDELAEVDSTLLLVKERTRSKLEASGEKAAPLNPVIAAYPSNYIRIAYNPITYFGKDGSKFMGVPEMPVYHRFMGSELIASDTIYHIAFSYRDPPDGSSYLKINSRNQAIMEFQISTQDGEHQVFAKFREYEGHYYPEIIKRKSLRLINRDVGLHQMDIHTFWFDEVKTEKLERIRQRDALKPGQTLERKSYEFTPEYWKKNESIKNYPLDSAIIKSLERFRSLDEQFKSNGKD